MYEVREMPRVLIDCGGLAVQRVITGRRFEGQHNQLQMIQLAGEPSMN